MTLPLPICAFTIPSIHDDTPLDCRVYHPGHLSLHHGRGREGPPPPRWRKRGAVVAHPYAPMGGSYDDPVVAVAGRALLEKGFVLGTFNFRGAGSSKGRTSWTSKAELADYISFAGFFIHYLHYLEPHHLGPSTAPSVGEHPLEPITSALPLTVEPTSFPFNSSEPPTASLVDERVLLILGGYSYGSLIATRLPSTPSILSSFTNNNLPHTSQSEILLRAHHCASDWNKEAAAALSSSLSRDNSNRRRSGVHHSPSGVVIGGEEGEPRERRKSSREYRRSFEIGRLSIEIPSRPSPSSSKRRSADLLRKRSSHLSPNNNTTSIPTPTASTPPPPSPQSIQTAYLLISPLLPPISQLATFSFSSSTPQTSTALTTNATLAIYGTHDIFASYRKLSCWAEEMATAVEAGGGGGGRGGFRNVVVEGAGHFWVEEGAEDELTKGVGGWAEGLLA